MPYIRQDVKNVFGFSTMAKCPKCEKLHKMVLDWKGRGTPRKYCQRCLQNMNHVTVGIDEDSSFNRGAAINYMVHTGRS